ncbi:sulfatase-like hydrolase/transferase [Luminiphilus sp. nBUS_07]|uniref:sulfatase-like hydrolase/transferase n=1 Tax=Luminiphilus sp. nBUS_07 TaxID=3395314 RepID=UPI003EB8E25F
MKFLFSIFVALLLPMMAIQYLYPSSVGNFAELVFAAAGVTLFLYAVLAFLSRIHTGLAFLTVGLLILASLMIRFSYGFLQDFTGMGYTVEFFAHAEWKSAKIAFSEYYFALLPLMVLVALFFLFLSKLGAEFNHKGFFPGALALFASLVLIFFGSNSSPEVLLASGYQEFAKRGKIAALNARVVRTDAAKLLQPLRAQRPLPTEKNFVVAKAPADPYNIVVVYLESFNENLTENDMYPGLTPNMDAMKKKYLSFSNNLSSGYVTIEGIFNSQCGTLVNMAYDNSSLTKAEARITKLPCMGDVLKKAGYKQVYLGGANLSFAGKGDFLLEHGYDQVLGLQHWRAQGFRDQNTIWGIPDTTLFDQAFKKITEMHKASAPFNVTLLTLGTHVPGYTYEGCPDYPRSDEPFIDAIHCTDFLLEKFLSQLDRNGVLENTVVYIQADHGVFHSRDMFRLFQKQGVLDKRLFTTVVIPEKRKQTLEIWDTEAQMSSLDMVANVLDLLEVEHNADFVLARSQINKPAKPRYVLTRYRDYDPEGRPIINETLGCENADAIAQPLRLPLDSCDKKRAMDAVYNFGTTFAYKTRDNQVCEYSAHARLDQETGTFHLRWGREYLTGSFSGSGRPVLSRMGIFTVILDENDQIEQQLFFSGKFKKRLKELQQVLESLAPGQRVVLASNASLDQIGEEEQAHWPEQLSASQFVYMTRTPSGFEIETAQTDVDFSIILRPASCAGGLQVTARDGAASQDGKIQQCHVQDWGPKTVVQGQAFNRSFQGNSKIWIETECAVENVSVVLGGRLVDTARDRSRITGSFSAERSLMRQGKYEVTLYDMNTGHVKKVGDLEATPAP